jgi:CDP-glycerol glycerophosphotransferase
MESPPGAIARDYPELVKIFRSGAYRDEAATEIRRVFHDRFSYLDDGQASERVVRRIFLNDQL